MADDWDLQAVVRGCSSSSSSSITVASSTTSSNFMLDSTTISHFGTQQKQQEEGQLFTLPDPTISTINFVEELHQLYKPFFPKSDLLSISSKPNTHTSSLSSNIHLASNNEQKQNQAAKSSQSLTVNNPRSKKRKNQIIKKVCQVPVESLSSDIWAWHKYGQKPIKGSPYPRGYYRCSSSKGCLARKQVERNRSDPTMFIVTYTADHNHSAPTHRNSLAGSTRPKPITSGNSNKHTTKTSSPETSLEEDVALDRSTAEESKLANLMGDEEEEDELGFSDMTVSDDFFVGLEGLVGSENEDCFFEHLPMSFNFSWVANNAATAAGGI